MYVLKYIYVRLVIFVLFSFNLLIDVAAPLFPSLTPTVAVSALSAWLSADLLVWEQCSVFALIPPWASSIGTRVVLSALPPPQVLENIMQARDLVQHNFHFYVHHVETNK